MYNTKILKIEKVRFLIQLVNSDTPCLIEIIDEKFNAREVARRIANNKNILYTQ